MITELHGIPTFRDVLRKKNREGITKDFIIGFFLPQVTEKSRETASNVK